MTFKKQLAYELTKQFNSERDAETAQLEFETRFQKGQIAQSDLPKVSLNTLKTGSPIADTLVAFGLASSKSEAKRLVEQKAGKINGVPAQLSKTPVPLHPGDTIEVGRKAVKITT